jgi:hypothetical protein
MRKFIINDVEVEEAEFNSRLEEAIENNVIAGYDDLLDDSYAEVEVAGMIFSPSQVLRQCDPVAYRCGIAEEVSYVLADSQVDLERGREVEFDGNTFEIRDED